MILLVILATEWFTCAVAATDRGGVGPGATLWTGGDTELGGSMDPPGVARDPSPLLDPPGVARDPSPLLHLSVIYKGNSSNQVCGPLWGCNRLVHGYGEGQDG